MTTTTTEFEQALPVQGESRYVLRLDVTGARRPLKHDKVIAPLNIHLKGAHE